MRNKKPFQSTAGNSTAVEDYLERILELINSKGYARVIDIAAALKISQASVTNMVQRHKLLTEFLRLLGVDDRVIDHDVEGMEHHISPSTLRAIAALTQHLRRRPALRAQLQTAVV